MRLGLPPRMSRAILAQYEREGADKLARKLNVIDELLADRDRIPLDAPEGAIYAAADRAARECHRFITDKAPQAHPEPIRLYVQAVCGRYGVRYPLGADDEEAWRRAVDPAWWVRALRREWSRRFEHTAIRLGFVGEKVDPYITRESAIRQHRRNIDNAKLLEQTEVTNGADTFTLAALAEKGVGNKANRRRELMVRLKGFEEIARELGHVGLFWTITTPSKYHAVGGKNRKYKDFSPREAQAYLCKVWARVRAAFKREGVAPYGFRIAEPHVDGCPHWHMLLFVPKEAADRADAIMREYALEEDGTEAGAKENRVALVRMIMDGQCSALGYIAKYIAKNIDGFGVGDHKVMDKQQVEGEARQTYVVAPDLFGDLELTATARVTFWAQTWGIRQFQQIGGAPVTVWRELRRVSKEAAEGAAPEVAAAWDAVQKKETGEVDEQGRPVLRQADWAAYLKAQGGTAPGRNYLVRIATDPVVVEGRYATFTQEKPFGVYAASMPELIHPSTRFTWTVVEKKPRTARPRTCVNNCTEPKGEVLEIILRDGAGAPISGTIPVLGDNGRWQNPRKLPKELENQKFSSIDVVDALKGGRDRAWNGEHVRLEADPVNLEIYQAMARRARGAHLRALQAKAKAKEA